MSLCGCRERAERAEQRVERLAEALVEAGIALEVLHAEIPYIRRGPLGKKIKALSPEMEAQIARAVTSTRKALREGGDPHA